MSRVAFTYDGDVYYMHPDATIEDPAGNRYTLRMAPDEIVAASAEARMQIVMRVIRSLQEPTAR